MKKTDPIQNVPIHERPHVVMLGAGASIAALPNGDANGKKLPKMEELIELLDINQLLRDFGIVSKKKGIEEIYSELHGQINKEVLEIFEQRVVEHFESFQLPAEPTIYDYLVLGLRAKDLIATMNWDPLLMQSLERNKGVVSLPQAVFLHGNIRLGYCETDDRNGTFPGKCNICHKPYSMAPLLYPITKQNYHKDKVISGEWEDFTQNLVNAMILTIFGFDAPQTDVDARKTLETAWKIPGPRELEEIEIININDRELIKKEWGLFIAREHYRIRDNFSNSYISNFPRRSSEAYFSHAYNIEPKQPQPAPSNVSLEELQDWFRKFGD